MKKRLSRIKDPVQRVKMQTLYAEVVFPKTMPAFSDLVVDRAGNLWVG